ncbi:unnamed protein product, partial [Oppiella nova]
MVVMAEDADRSAVFDEIRNFSQRKLKKVETKVTSGSGEVITEKRGAKGVQTIKHEGIKGAGYVVDNKPDLQVGLIIPGLMICKTFRHESPVVEDHFQPFCGPPTQVLFGALFVCHLCQMVPNCVLFSPHGQSSPVTPYSQPNP